VDGWVHGRPFSLHVHPVSCTVVCQHAGPGRLDPGGTVAEPGMVCSPGAMQSSGKRLSGSGAVTFREASHEYR